MNCKTCKAITKHRLTDTSGVEACSVCGTERAARQRFGGFPELSAEQNEIILEARALGFAAFYPAIPDARAQAMATLKSAIKWIEANSHRLGDE